MGKRDKEIITINDDYSYEVIHLANRVVYKPNNALYGFQGSILRLLKFCLPLSMNIVDSVNVHTNKKWILKMDIRHFFESVPLRLIEKQLKILEDKIGLYSVDELKEGVLINNKLAVGSRTSPHIANACMKNIDNSIKECCKEEHVEYSRYMDDLFFSGENKKSLEKIQKTITTLLNNNGFEINNSKTKLVSNGQKQTILGIIVNNKKPALSKETKSKIRAILYQYMTGKIDDYNTLNGYLSYTYSIDKAYFKKLYSYYKALKSKAKINPEQRHYISKMFNRNIRKTI